jgi:HEPN domain-containing protein
MKMDEYEENFSEGASYNLRMAKEAIEKESYPDSFIHSYWALENTLKAVLVKGEKFDKKKDRHHRCLKLLSKIKCEKIIPPNVQEAVEKQVKDMLTIDIPGTGGGHIDSLPERTHIVISNIRYFDAERYIGVNEAKAKLKNIENIYDLLKPFI